MRARPNCYVASVTGGFDNVPLGIIGRARWPKRGSITCRPQFECHHAESVVALRNPRLERRAIEAVEIFSSTADHELSDAVIFLRRRILFVESREPLIAMVMP